MNNSKKPSFAPCLSKTLTNALAISSCVTLAFFLFMRLYNPLGTVAYGMSFASFLCILVFSLIISCARLIFSVTVLNKVLAWIINYAILIISFFIVFTLSRQIEFDSSAEIFVGIFLFTIVYLIIVAMNVIVKKLFSSTKNQEPKKKKEYEKQF